MKTLLSKIQYYYYEKGEFSNIESRSLEDTLLLIHSFPWKEQRNEIFINLNGPSVTIENGSGAFLKLGIDYNGKFILYYLNERNHIFCKTGKILSEFDETVRDFFGAGIKENALNKYRDWLFQKRKHFLTGEFEYKISLRRILSVLFGPIIITLMFLSVFILEPKESGLLFFIIFIIIFFGAHWVLLLNYYFFCKNLSLKISRGIDEFYFGKKNNIKKYSKKDIKNIITYNNQTYKNPWGDFYVYHIEFRNGEMIKLTNLIIGSTKLSDKFPEHFVNNKHKAFAIVKNEKYKTI